MSSIFNSIGIDPGYIIIALMILVIALIVLVIILLTKVTALNTKYTAFMKGKNGAELEQVIYERFGELDIMQQIAEYIINDGAITVMELNETDTELWKRAVKSFGGATLASVL